MRTFPLSELLRGDQADGCKYRQGKSTALQLSDLHYFTLLIRMNEKPAYHSPNCVWSIKRHYRPPLAPVYLTTKHFIPGLTDWLTDWESDWLTDLVIVWQGLDNTCTCIYVGATCLKLSPALQPAERLQSEAGQPGSNSRGGVNIHKAENTSQSASDSWKKHEKIAQCLWVRARQRISAFRQTDGLTERDRREGGRRRCWAVICFME